MSDYDYLYQDCDWRPLENAQRQAVIEHGYETVPWRELIEIKNRLAFMNGLPWVE